MFSHHVLIKNDEEYKREKSSTYGKCLVYVYVTNKYDSVQIPLWDP